MKGPAMELNDPKLKTLAALHELNSNATRAIETIDKRTEGVTDTTIEVNVEALRNIRQIIFAQRYALQQLVEHQAEIDDAVEKALAKLTNR
jgi:hypothetical protein